MPTWLDRWLKSLEVLSWWEILIYTAVAAFVTQWLVTKVVRLLSKRTKTSLDDTAIGALRWPLFITVVFVGINIALKSVEPVDPGSNAANAALAAYKESHASWAGWVKTLTSLMISLAVIFWMRAFMRVSDALLSALARRADDFKWIEPASLPLYEIFTKLALLAGGIYGLMVAWKIDLTAWLASAGILGIAIGFAAKDTLANLFAGIFILADAPYKMGDFIVIESGERGKVTDIGIRSTRILTRDDIEITLPNGLMANSKVINESSGPYVKRRLRVQVGIAYGSDIEKAREAMLAAAGACDLLASNPAPSVRFRSFGESALIFQLRGYINQPVLHGRALDQVCTKVYEALNEAQVTIPFPQRVVHMKSS